MGANVAKQKSHQKERPKDTNKTFHVKLLNNEEVGILPLSPPPSLIRVLSQSPLLILIPL
jgi:hypothetical protein